jgi:phytoene dehydrogenase-like protein
MTAPRRRVLIVGGGLAGLACAVRLHEAGAQPLILEASDDVGGRVRTDVVDGFRLDRGFQVFLDAYPEAGKLLNLPRLDLRQLHLIPTLILPKHLKLFLKLKKPACLPRLKITLQTKQILLGLI